MAKAVTKARPRLVGRRASAERRRRWWPRPLVVRWYLHLTGFLLALAALVIAIGPTYPGEQHYLVTAEGLKAGLRYDLALARYADASAVAPTDPRPYCLTGDIRVLQQEWSAAVSAYTRCADLGPDQAGSWLRLGNARQALGNTGVAVSAWERAAAFGNTSALRQLASTAEQRGDITGAIRLWQRLPASDPEALAHLGMLSLWEGNTALAGLDFRLAAKSGGPAAAQPAQEGFTALVALPQDTSQTQGELGHAFLAANIPALAARPFERAVSLAPRSGVAHAYLGWTLLQLNRPLQAKPEIAKGVSLSPSVGFVWFAAGELALALGQPSLALGDFQYGATLDPGNPLFFAEAGQVALQLHNYTAAEQFTETASNLSTAPTEAIALLSIYVDFHLGMDDGTARAAGIRAVTRWPHTEALEFLLAQIFADSNQMVDAYYATVTAHLLDPIDPGPYVYLGAQAENEGDYVTAALDLRIALALRPNGPLAPEARTLLAPIADVSA